MNRKTLAITLGINIVLFSTIVTLYFTIWLPSRRGEMGTLTITGFPIDDIKLNITQLESLPSVSKEYRLLSDELIIANYTGVSVYYLVTQVANITEFTDVNIIASDNWEHPFTSNEINQTQDMIIAYKKDGEYMKGKSFDGEGPLRLIVPQKYEGEYNAQHCGKYIVVLEIITD